jgi:hypothetical protein
MDYQLHTHKLTYEYVSNYGKDKLTMLDKNMFRNISDSEISVCLHHIQCFKKILTYNIISHNYIINKQKNRKNKYIYEYEDLICKKRLYKNQIVKFDYYQINILVLKNKLYLLNNINNCNFESKYLKTINEIRNNVIINYYKNNEDLKKLNSVKTFITEYNNINNIVDIENQKIFDNVNNILQDIYTINNITGYINTNNKDILINFFYTEYFKLFNSIIIIQQPITSTTLLKPTPPTSTPIDIPATTTSINFIFKEIFDTLENINSNFSGIFNIYEMNEFNTLFTELIKNVDGISHDFNEFENHIASFYNTSVLSIKEFYSILSAKKLSIKKIR